MFWKDMKKASALIPAGQEFAVSNCCSLGWGEKKKKKKKRLSPEYDWKLALSLTSSEGNAELDVTIPDTITEWKASAFCMSPDTGFGLSPTMSLRAFQPFFVDLTLPYSIIHGEDFLLRANVFNYLNHCIKVGTSAHTSSPYPTSKQSVVWKSKQIDKQTVKQKRV